MPDEDRCELGGAVDLPLLTTTALDAVRAAGGVHQIAEGLIASISASVWSAVADVAIQPDLYSAQNGEDVTSRLRKAAQLRLADTHADLFHVALTRSAPKKRLRDTLEKLREVKPERVWQPRRPKLAIEIASLIQREVGLAHVPDEKAAQCTLPLKIFAKEVAAFLKNNPHASDFSEKSLVYAVNEVCAAVVGEAEAVRAVERANELVVEDVGCASGAARQHRCGVGGYRSPRQWHCDGRRRQGACPRGCQARRRALTSPAQAVQAVDASALMPSLKSQKKRRSHGRGWVGCFFSRRVRSPFRERAGRGLGAEGIACRCCKRRTPVPGSSRSLGRNTGDCAH